MYISICVWFFMKIITTYTCTKCIFPLFIIIFLPFHTEDQIRREVEEAKAAIKAGDPQTAFNHVSNAARYANRVAAIAKAEIANTEDPAYAQELQRVADNVTASKCILLYYTCIV